jgi:ribosomal subunit interface protein
MQIQIHANDFDLTEGLRHHIARRIAYAINHGRDIVSRIVVRLSDVNGPRGGVDKRCGIEVRLKGASAIAIADTQSDLYVAIDRAAERTGRTLDRRIARRHQLTSRQSHPGHVDHALPETEGLP